MITPSFRYTLEKNRNDFGRTKKEMIMVDIRYRYCRLNSQGRKIYVPCKLSLQAKIFPKDFGYKENGFKFDREVFEKYSKRNRDIKNRMSDFERIVTDVAMTYPIQITPSPDELKLILLDKLGRVQKVDNSYLSIIDFLNEQISRYENELVKQTEGSLSEDSIKIYRSLRTLIMEYQSATNEVLTFSNLNELKYWHLWDVLDDILRGKIELTEKIRKKAQVKQEYGYSVNSIRKYQNALLKTLNEAKEHYGVSLALDTKRSGLKLKKADAKKEFYLTEKELQLIIDSDVGYDKSLQQAKDYLIIASCTGLRFQSMVHATSQTVEVFKDKDFHFQYFISEQKKTKTKVLLPILELVQKILEKNGGSFPRFGANGTMNKRLKSLCELIGIDADVKETITSFKDGEVVLNRKKYELVSTHDGRKSFRSNLNKLNADRNIVSDMTHPDRKPQHAMDKEYIKTTMMDKAILFVKELKKVDSTIYKLGELS